MPYNTSIAALERWKSELDILWSRISTVGIAIRRVNHPDVYAYRLREALAAARANDVSPYKDWRLTFKIDENKVLVMATGPSIIISDEGETADEQLQVPAAVTQFEVVSYLSSNMDSGIRYSFPNLRGPTDLLEQWLKSKGVEMLKNHPVTVRLPNVT